MSWFNNANNVQVNIRRCFMERNAQKLPQYWSQEESYSSDPCEISTRTITCRNLQWITKYFTNNSSIDSVLIIGMSGLYLASYKWKMTKIEFIVLYWVWRFHSYTYILGYCINLYWRLTVLHGFRVWLSNAFWRIKIVNMCFIIFHFGGFSYLVIWIRVSSVAVQNLKHFSAVVIVTIRKIQ